MSRGITPSEFVRQVFYVQEKVNIDFYPDDDKYKEVLTEANLVLQELQGQEDWTWLRVTAPVGFTGKMPSLFHHHRHRHIMRSLKPEEVQLPSWVYKPSTLWSDCVRLCRWRWKPEVLKTIHRRLDEFYWWGDQGVVEPDHAYIFRGDCELRPVDLADYEPGGVYLFDLDELNQDELAFYIDRGCWYTDVKGNLYIGGDEDCHPFVIYECLNPGIPEDCHCHHHRCHHDHANEHPNMHGCCEYPPQHYIEIYPDLHNEILPDCCDGHCHRRPPRFMYRHGLQGLLEVIDVDYNSAIRVPYISTGSLYNRNHHQTNGMNYANAYDVTLGVACVGDRLVFNRPLAPWEQGRVIVADVQEQIEQFHVCNDECISENTMAYGKHSAIKYPSNPCHRANDLMLTKVPDPNYVVYRTAALHAEGSPAAAGRALGLADNAAKLLSQMRSNDASATMPDMAAWDHFGVIDIC